MRLRGGNVYSSDGAVIFLREVLGKVNAYIIRIRGDSAFYRKDFVDECERKRIFFTITADLTVSLLEKIRSKYHLMNGGRWGIMRLRSFITSLRAGIGNTGI